MKDVMILTGAGQIGMAIAHRKRKENAQAVPYLCTQDGKTDVGV